MLQAEFSAPFLKPDDLDLLCRVLAKVQRMNGTAMDRETQAAMLLQLFQSGICDEEGLIEAMTRRERA